MSLFPLPSSLLYANDILDNIEVTDASEIKEDGETVTITFTDPATPGKLKFKAGQATADVLLVGGGGGGGRPGGTSAGGGGGGGAGGFVEVLSVPFKGEYTITVGAGGAGAAKPSSTADGLQGESGKDSTIRNGGAAIAALPDAKGGGGGGAGGNNKSTTGPGLLGGSGGGGSSRRKSTSGYVQVEQAGGDSNQSAPGLGNAGGAGGHRWVGAGGGGAGGAAAGTTGDDVQANVRPSAGGSGKQSQITGQWYAGGGSGGKIGSGSTGGCGEVPGGSGVGGSGGDNDYQGTRDAKPSTGGGGGGGTITLAAGNGADGIVVIRLSGYLKGDVTVPTIEPHIYDGKPYTAVQPSAYYTIDPGSENVETDVGENDYEVTLTLVPGKGYKWDDDKSTTPRVLKWNITPKPVDKPEWVNGTGTYTYNYAEQTGFKESGEYTLDEKNKATVAGTYEPKATLAHALNYKWSDDTPTVTRSDLVWTIEKLKIDPPVRTSEKFTFSGEEQTGYVEEPDKYTFDEQNKGTDAKTYTPTATLVDANTEWTDGEPSLSWTIDPLAVDKPTVRTGLEFTGEEQVAFVQPEADSGKYALSGEKGTNAGTYTLVAKLSNDEAQNYKWRGGDFADLELKWSIAVREIAWPPAGALPEYPYEKGTKREPIPASEGGYYERGGRTEGETAGSYTTTAALNFNELPSVTNVVWKLSDGTVSADPTNWVWTIVAQQVPIPQPKDFTYDGSAHIELEIPPDALYHQAGGDDLTQTYADHYECQLALNDPENTVWEDGLSEDRTFAWTIAKADNEVLSLSVPDWQVGAPSPSTPSCALKFGYPQISWYSWSASETGPWSKWQSSVPTEAGTYYLRVDAPETDNWHATNRVESFCVWVHPSEVFTDFVDITLSGTQSGLNKTVAIKIGPAQKRADGSVEGGLPGFEYMRTGLGGGEIRFIQANATDSRRDNLLPYKMAEWNPSGESTIHVKVANLTASTKIRMYWHAKDGDPKSANHPEEVTEAPVAAPAVFSLVSREGQLVDYWTEMPSISKSVWNIEAPPTEADVTHGALKEGTVATYYLSMPVGTTNDVIQTDAGTYAIVFARAGNDPAYTIFDGEKRVGYEVVWHNTYENLGGTLGGRILLGNNDTMEGHVITGQAYWQTDPATSPTYWEHDEVEPPESLLNLDYGVNHVLYCQAGSEKSVLWRLTNMRIGSSYRNNGASSLDRNYLPWSKTSQPRTAPDVAMSTKEVSCLVMRNMGGYRYKETPAIYSPCYTNGLGAIYFDAVNGWTDDGDAQVMVEVAIQTLEGKPPTDENCASERDPDNPFYNLAFKDGKEKSEEEDAWLPLKPTVLYKAKDASEFVVDASQTLANNWVNLKVTTGGGSNEFYRIIAENPYTNEVVRFRIRRPVKSGTTKEDTSNLILLDNVHASPPAMRADLTSPGVSDATRGRTGKQMLGMAGALSTAFPARTDEGVLGRAAIRYKTTEGIDCDKSKFIASARFNYRWRYLNQSFDDWQTVYLDHTRLAGEDGEILPTVAPLDFTGRQGDIEWYYDMTLQAPAYKYVDYSGDGVEKPVGDFNEEIRSVTNALWNSGVTLQPQASAGKDWFVRLREGQSNWEGFRVEIRAIDEDAKPIAGEYDMELVDNNMWRAMVVVPTNALGKCAFRFFGDNLHEGGDPDRVTEATRLYGAPEANEEPVDIPTNGKIVENGHGVTFTVDQAAGYLEFRVSDSFLTYQVGRAEYQDFNSWNDAHTPKAPSKLQRFRADSTDTNSVNVADMKTEKADIAGWPAFMAVNGWWNESFPQADYAPTPGSSRFEKEIFHTTHETPNGWAAQNITFVSEMFVNADEQKEKSGMAGKLLGGGSGKIDFTGAMSADERRSKKDRREDDNPDERLERPEGLEKVTLNARLGQSYSFGSMAYDASQNQLDSYMFFVPVTMSHRTQSNVATPDDMAVGASASVVGYYFPGLGCYEFRVERLMMGKDTTEAANYGAQVRLSVYKWYSVGEEQWRHDRLAYRDFTVPAWTYEKTGTGWTAERNRSYFGLFISLETDYSDGDLKSEPEMTRIIAGLSEASPIVTSGETSLAQPWKHFIDKTFRGLVVEDRDDPFGWGSYGVAAKDCPAQFPMPMHRLSPYEGYITEQDNADDRGEGGKFFEQALVDEDEQPAFPTDWTVDRKELMNKRRWTLQGRYECFTNTATGFTTTNPWIGLRTPTNIAQTVDLYLKPKGKDESQWKKYRSQPVSSYGFSGKTFDLKLPGSWDLRLATGADSTADVVVDDIVQHRWTAPDVNDPDKITSAGYGTVYVFSQGVVQTNATAKWVKLQPARANPERPVSLRGPILGGLGKFTFDYKNADEHAEVWVQVATNLVSGNLTGDDGYNNSIKSKELGEQQDIGEWLTVAKYSAQAATADLRLRVGDPNVDTKSVYLGWHNHADKPIEGFFRLFVPPATVIAATNAAVQAGNVDYGRIEVTASSCTDEPGVSARSWRGWNMRTIGDSGDSEKRMNLVDMVIAGGGQGLVAALNNSTSDVEDNKGEGIDPDDLKLKSGFPAIYSPTMHPLKPTSGVGSVTVKARLYSTTGVPETSGGGRITIWGAKDSRAEKWTELDTFEVKSSVFSNFTWTAGREVYTAVKFEVSDRSAKTPRGDYDRVILDEIVIGEKVPPTINFVYARPFRMSLFAEEPIDDILSPAEQPLAGESWGVQTRLTLQQLTDEIDLERGFEVSLSYFRGEKPWGYGNWCSNSQAVVDIPLRQVGEASNLVFRSVGDRPESLVGPSSERGEVVQFMLKVRYWDRGGKDDEMTLPIDWKQPDWFYPLDYNRKNGAADDDRNFSAYTVLDSVSPGRAWINEVSWNDGPADQNGGKAPTENQFMEICVPAGVDLTDWEVWVTESGNHDRQLLARLGDTFRKIPGSKSPTANCTNGYEFLVLKSPTAQVAEADASWYAVNLGTVVRGGVLSYGDPYQFELVRPSGVIEHQFVLDGTNELSRWSWGAIFDGTNFVHELAGDDILKFPNKVSPKRFYAGRELARRPGDKLASVGVVGGEDGEDTANWPGGSNTWAEAMAFTPGRINAGQVIPEGWFIAPNGTNTWVYFSVEDGRIRQSIGGETNQTVLAVVPQGQTTNVHYTVDGWYEGSVSTNGVVVTSGRTGSFVWTVAPTGSMYYVRAATAPQAKLAERFDLTGDNPYTPAVLKWLAKWKADGTADDIRLARFKGLHSIDSWSFMDLTDMYWLDIPPVPETPEEWAHNDGTNWWFRGGIDKFSGENHIIHRKEYRGGELVDVAYTNKQITVTLYATNEVTHEAWSPAKLQGLNNESSAGEYGTSWTSVTFKVKGRLDLSEKSPYLPFRTFIFDGDSFDENHQAVIDILDPFQSPIGRAYDWDQHPNSSAYFQWRIDTKYYPYSIEMLKADSTYKDEE